MNSKFQREIPEKCIFKYMYGVSKECSMCKASTEFYEDVGLDNPLCSLKCYENWWKEFATASAERS